MIIETTLEVYDAPGGRRAGYWVRVPGETCPRGPFRSRRQVEQALANVAAKAERAAAPETPRPLPKSEPIEPRVVKRVPPSGRLKRRKLAIKARIERKVEKRRAKLGRVKRADPDGAKAVASSAQGGPQGDTGS